LDQRELTHVGFTEQELTRVGGYFRKIEVGMNKTVWEKSIFQILNREQNQPMPKQTKGHYHHL